MQDLVGFDGEGAVAQDWFAQNGISTGSAAHSAGTPVPGMPGFVYNQYGGYEPGTPATTAAAKPTTPTGNTGVNPNAPVTGMAGSGGSFADQIRAQLQQAYPSKAQDPNWLNQTVQYYAAKQGTDGKPDSYWLDRAAGQGAGGTDVAEAGKYAGQDFGSLAQQQGTAGYSGDAFSYQPYQSGGSFTPPSTTAGTFDYSAAPSLTQLGQPTPYTPQSISAQQITQPNAVTAGTVTAAQSAAPGAISGSQVQGPQALNATQLQDAPGYQGLTAAQLAADPSYQFRLSQGLGALQNSAAAKGTLLTGGFAKGLNDYAAQSASQEYGAADARARQTYNDTYNQNANTVGQNNAANAQAYGLTNQYQQQAALANQANNFNVQNANVNNATQNNQFNAGLTQNANLANIGNTLNADQFNAGQNFSTQAANQAANLNASQFNSTSAQNENQQNFLNGFNTTQANNQNAIAANAQGFNQANTAYNTNLAALGQNYNQAYNTWQGNANYGLQANNQAFNQANTAYNTNVGAQLGNSNFGLNAQNQAWNQANTVNNQNWLQQYQLAQLGLPPG